MSRFSEFIEPLISGFFPLALLLFCGIYLTLKCRFFQFKNIFSAFRYSMGGFFGKREKNGIDSFGAACTSLSATVGTGNIAGVAGAVAIGGAGAVFWMWVSAAFGMCIKCAEIVLALSFREKKGGEYRGGPMYYIKYGLPKKFMPLSFAFAVSALAAAAFSGGVTQTNAAADTLNGQTQKLIFGTAAAFITVLVLAGGAKRISGFTEKAVPLMALFYIVMSVGVISVNMGTLPSAFKMILTGAFNPRAVTGGAVGSMSAAVLTGASRGVFSNEAGLGTTAMAHGASEGNDGAKQALCGIFETFVDTFLICTLTALTILCSGVKIEYGRNASSELMAKALSSVYGSAADIFVFIMMCLFSISSVIGWGFYGDMCRDFIFKKKGKGLFLLMYAAVCITGALMHSETAWRLSAFFNGIMLCINVFAVMLLSPVAVKKILEIKGNENDR